MFGHLLVSDARLYLFVVHELRVPFLDRLAPLVSFLGNFPSIWFFLFLALAAFGARGHRITAALGLTVLLLTWLVGDYVLKEAFARPRPFEVFPAVKLLLPPPPDHSFPSTHAATSVAAAAVLWAAALRPWMRVAALTLALLIGFSRVYVGVHYPLDVLGGAAFGLLVAAAGLWTAKYGHRCRQERHHRRQSP